MVKGDTMDDSIFVGQYFQAREFRCPCCGVNTVHKELVEVLDMIRKKIGVSIRINSGVRCEAHNRSIGGALRSYHLPREGIGHAADITFGRTINKLPLNIARLFIVSTDVLSGKGGVILYPTWVHVDVRHILSRNTYRNTTEFAWPRIN
tara:strand:+ start:783 stop:1229 length:447 start_codon:yes stop_codon:yes gene_type:complete